MDAQAIASAEQIRSTGGRGPQRRYKLVGPLPVNGLRLRIQSLTEREVAEYEMEVIASGGQGLNRSRMLSSNGRLFVRVIVDGEGNRILADEDARLFADWDAADTGQLYEEACRHCGINRRDLEQLEDAAKNSADALAG